MDPRRLVEEPGSDLDVLLLEAGIDEAPPAQLADRTLVSLGVASAAVGLTLGAAGTGAAGAKAGASVGGLGGALVSWGLGTKIAVGMVALGAALGSGYVVLESDPAARPVAPPPAPLEVGAPGLGAGAPAEDVASEQPAAASDQAAAADARAAAAPGGAGEQAAPPPGKPQGASGSPAPYDAAQARPSPAVHEGAPVAPRAPSKAGGLKEETQLLDAARRALIAGDRQGALAQLDAHAARFPDGKLKLEARALRARAAELK